MSNYRAFIQNEGENYYGETKRFTTLPIDITGTWLCIAEGYEPFYVTLHNGNILTGSFEGNDLIDGNWRYGNNKLTASANTYKYDNGNSYSYRGTNFGGTLEDEDNPGLIKGYFYTVWGTQWNSGQSVEKQFTMTKQ